MVSSRASSETLAARKGGSAVAGPPAGAKQFNKLAVLLAGHRLFPLWAVLRHRGRKTGKEYAVPVAVIATPTTFVIALPWGRETDWVRNTLAAGRCTVRWKGVDHECTDPAFVDRDVALAAARGVTRRALRRRDFRHGFIQLTRHAAP
jgi:deazaflavin-dependent oxidoreductase (nitroreductase family)